VILGMIKSEHAAVPPPEDRVEPGAAVVIIPRATSRQNLDAIFHFKNRWPRCAIGVLPRPPSGDRGYRYRKSYVVSPEQHRGEITYELENLGSQEIEIDQYNHNWLALSPASPSNPWIIRTPLIPGPRSLLHCRVSPGELMFHALPQEVVYFTFAQKDSPSESSTVVSDGRKRISITCHFSASRLSIFTQGNLLAPEIFAHFLIPPAGTRKIDVRREFL
jgi:hypothetical protein